MHVLKITRNKLELVSLPLYQNVLTVGRSPSCDAVLRTPDAQPIQFLVKWTSEDQMSPSGPHWKVSTIPDDDNKTEGVAYSLNKGPQLVSGFQFEIIDDPLASANIDRPLNAQLGERLIGVTTNLDRPTQGPSTLEIIRMDRETEKIFAVYHMDPVASKEAVAILKGVSIKWSDVRSLVVRIEPSSSYEVFLNAEQQASTGNFKLDDSRIIEIRSHDSRYFLRFVASLKSYAIPDAEARSRVLYTASWLFIGAIAVIGYLLGMGKSPEVKLSPPRVVRIEAPVEVPAIPESFYPPAEVLEQTVTTNTPATPTTPPKLTPTPLPKMTPTPEPVKPKNLTPRVAKAVPRSAQRESGRQKPSQAPAPIIGLLDSLKKTGAPTRLRAKDILLGQPKDADVLPSEHEIAIEANLNQKSDFSGTSLKELAQKSDTRKSEIDTSTGDRKIREQKAAQDREIASIVGGGLLSRIEYERDGGITTGGLTRDQVLGELERYRLRIKNCYDSALAISPSLQGRLVFRWVITPEGGVDSIKKTDGEISFPRLENCISSVISEVKFPLRSRPTNVIYPFLFKKTR